MRRSNVTNVLFHASILIFFDFETFHPPSHNIPAVTIQNSDVLKPMKPNRLISPENQPTPSPRLNFQCYIPTSYIHIPDIPIKTVR